MRRRPIKLVWAIGAGAALPATVLIVFSHPAGGDSALPTWFHRLLVGLVLWPLLAATFAVPLWVAGFLWASVRRRSLPPAARCVCGHEFSKSDVRETRNHVRCTACGKEAYVAVCPCGTPLHLTPESVTPSYPFPPLGARRWVECPRCDRISPIRVKSYVVLRVLGIMAGAGLLFGLISAAVTGGHRADIGVAVLTAVLLGNAALAEGILNWLSPVRPPVAAAEVVQVTYPGQAEPGNM